LRQDGSACMGSLDCGREITAADDNGTAQQRRHVLDCLASVHESL
jgi:hypothetical protein